eukprot:1147595-Pelagomonas_calceolata.AAC.11
MSSHTLKGVQDLGHGWLLTPRSHGRRRMSSSSRREWEKEGIAILGPAKDAFNWTCKAPSPTNSTATYNCPLRWSRF